MTVVMGRAKEAAGVTLVRDTWQQRTRPATLAENGYHVDLHRRIENDRHTVEYSESTRQAASYLV
jgi:hypothetical protein